MGYESTGRACAGAGCRDAQSEEEAGNTLREDEYHGQKASQRATGTVCCVPYRFTATNLP